MAARKKGNVETGLVQRRVVDAEFVDRKDDALAEAFSSSQETIKDLVELMTKNYAQSIVHVQVLSDAFTKSLEVQVAANNALQESLDRKEERRLKRDKEKAQQDFLKSLAGDIRVLLPQLMNRLGKNPTVSAPEAALLRPLIEELNEKQIAGIMSQLTQSQQLALIEILKNVPDAPEGKIRKEPNGAH